MEIPSILVEEQSSAGHLKSKIAEYYKIQEESFYLTQNGRICNEETLVNCQQLIRVCLRLRGGKGGFGSMLRAIGAQIEKTTNRDACRDLSGRRLRDINEEQQLKRWFSKQEEREIEKEELRKKKLEKLRQIQEGPPLPIMDDPEYNRQRSEMADSVYEAVDKGFEVSKPTKSATSSTITSKDSGAASSTSSSSASDNDSLSCPPTTTEKNQPPPTQPSSSSAGPSSSSTKKPIQPKKKIKKLMMDEDFSSGSSSDESDTEPSPAKKAKVT